MAAALTGVNWDDAIAASDVALAGKKPMEYLAAFAEQLVDGGMTELQAQMGQLFASLALRWQLEGPAEAVARARKKAKVFYDHQMPLPPHAEAMRRSRAWARADRATAATRPCGARSAGRAGNSIVSAALAAARATREICTTSTSRAMRAIASVRATSAAATFARALRERATTRHILPRSKTS